MEKIDQEVVSTSLQKIGAEQVRGMLVEALKAYPDRIRRLGVSRSYFVALVAKHALTQDDVDTLVHARIIYGGSLPKMSQLLAKGLSATDICLLYELREGLSGHQYSVSMKVLYRFSRTFAEADLQEEVELSPEFISDTASEVMKIFWWIKYLDQALNLVCDVAEAHELVTVEAALDVLKSQAPIRHEFVRISRSGTSHSIPASSDPGYQGEKPRPELVYDKTPRWLKPRWRLKAIKKRR